MKYETNDDETEVRSHSTIARETQTIMKSDNQKNCPTWNEDWTTNTLSPLRLIFAEDDPDRDRTPDVIAKLQQVSVLTADATIKFQLDWVNAIALIIRAASVGVFSSLRENGQMVISGYRLTRHGVLNEPLKLTPEECRNFSLSDPPTLDEARDKVMSVYIDLLGHGIANEPEHLAHLSSLYTRLTQVWT